MTETPASVEQVPLQEPDPGLIDEIFSKEAEELTDEDIDVIVAEFRSDRLAFLQAAEEGAKKPTKRAAGAASKAKETAANLSIDDLFGGA